MIDEKKLIEDIHEYFKRHIDNIYCKDADGDKTVILNFNADIHRIVENQPKVGEWIPCSERLPGCNNDDYSDEVLVAIRYAHDEPDEDTMIAVGYYIFDSGDDTGWWTCTEHSYNKVGRHHWGNGKGYSELYKGDKVIAWMPLPEPYREEKDRKWED